MVSPRLSNIHESTTMKISTMAKKLTASGLDIIDLGVGEPDFDTPKHIAEAGCNSIKTGETHYAPTAEIARFPAISRHGLASCASELAQNASSCSSYEAVV